MMHVIFRLPRAVVRSSPGWVLAALAVVGATVSAETIPLPSDGSDLVGELKYVTARHEDTLIDIARRYSVGQDEIVMANPTVDRWLPKEGTKVILPRRYILPDAPRAGIVVNIPEMRMFYYPVKYAPPAKAKPVAATKPAKPPKPGEKAPPAPKPQPVAEVGEPIGRAGEVITYPISIGRIDWKTPLGKTRVVQKVTNPVWIPPESIKREHAKDGDILPDVVPAGPDNPLGLFAMKLGVPGYLIHGTDRAKADGIGMRVTHGCIRMYPEDIERLFPKVAVGTPVYLINQPIKLGWDKGRLYMEVHQPLDEDSMSSSQLYNLAMAEIQKKVGDRPVQLDKEVIRKAVAKPSGLPVEIGRAGLPTLEAEPADGVSPGTPRERPAAGADPYAAPTTPRYGTADERYPGAGASRPPAVDPYGQPGSERTPRPDSTGAGAAYPYDRPTAQPQYRDAPYESPYGANRAPAGYGAPPPRPEMTAPAPARTYPYGAGPPAEQSTSGSIAAHTYGGSAERRLPAYLYPPGTAPGQPRYAPPPARETAEPEYDPYASDEGAEGNQPDAESEGGL